MLRLQRTTSDDHDFRDLVNQLDQELWQRYHELQGQYSVHNIVENNRNVIVAYWNGKPVGCGCFKAYDTTTAEIKRMFVHASKRGKGIASEIVNELCRWATEAGYHRAILETGIRQPEAIRLYQKAGFTNIANYPPYVGMSESVCMEKILNKKAEPSVKETPPV